MSIRTDPVRRALTAGIWGLPVSTALLAVGTVTHQPDPRADFAGYAEYVTGPTFLASHLGASVLGAAVGIVGTASVALLAARPSGRPGRTLAGAAAAVLATVLNTAVFGVAAFAQPAIGRAARAGVEGIEAVDADVYGPELFATAAVALVAWTVGAVLLGAGIGRSGPGLRVPGVVLAAALVVFYPAGIVGSVVQPLAAVVATVAAVAVARRLPPVAEAAPLEAVPAR
ncbi:hypothetical protein ACI79D_04490 [Geodermatophilus sp. SYSU D00708]